MNRGSFMMLSESFILDKDLKAVPKFLPDSLRYSLGLRVAKVSERSCRSFEVYFSLERVRIWLLNRASLEGGLNGVIGIGLLSLGPSGGLGWGWEDAERARVMLKKRTFGEERDRGGGRGDR